MGKSWMVMFALAACQPMYGAAPQKLRTPAPVARPVTAGTAEVTAPVVYDEDCVLLTSAPIKPTRAPAEAEQHVSDGDRALRDYETAAPADKPARLVDGIDDYTAALKGDPYHARATLKLAIAYDKALRKGCALALLDRLAKLATHPKLGPAASEAIDEVLQRRTWFAGYRKDATRAVGHPGHP